MEVITIEAPWPSVGTIDGSDYVMRTMNVRVLYQGDRVDFVMPGTSAKHVAVFDMKGCMIWNSGSVSGSSVSWGLRTSRGARVPCAVYIYRIACGGSVMKGTVMVAKGA
jgi:hypothetical protein